jgi:hypothetical protein
MVRLIDGPHQKLLACSLAFRPEPEQNKLLIPRSYDSGAKKNSLLPIHCGKRSKGHRKRIHIFPEIFPSYIRTVADIRTTTIWQIGLGERQEPGMP